MVRCGYCASNLQAIATLSHFEILLTSDNVAVFIPNKEINGFDDNGGMIETWSIDERDGCIKLVAKIDHLIDLKKLCNCNAICGKTELERRNNEYLLTNPDPYHYM